MKLLSNPKRLPAAVLAGSLFCMLAITAFTNPVSNIIYALMFFLALMAFLVSAGYLMAIKGETGISLKTRFRIFIISLLLTMMLMFRSAGALGWLDAAALILISIGLLFYGGRRL